MIKHIRDSKPSSKAWLEEMGEQTDSPKENLRNLLNFILIILLMIYQKLV